MEIIEKRSKTDDGESAASKFISSTVTDDLMLEILVRLPDCRTAIQCSSVCKRWSSLILHSSFIPSFINHHRHQLAQYDSAYTFVFRCYTVSLSGSLYRRSIAFCQWFSEKSKTLHGNPKISSSDTSNYHYLNFIPNPNKQSILSYFDDLLLVSTKLNGSGFYVFNPLTKQCIELPDPPQDKFRNFAYGLVCQTNTINVVARYRVMIIYNDFSVANGSPFVERAAIFSSETGQWNKSTLMFSGISTGGPNLKKIVAASNGVIYWPQGEPECKQIAAFDPFSEDKDKQCRSIELPVNFSLGWCAREDYVHLGVVRGKLRLLQLFMIKRYGYVLKIWELNHNDNNTSGDNNVASSSSLSNTSWILVHEVRPNKGGKNMMHFCAFHPYNSDVIFLLRKNVICRYEIGVGEYEKVGELPDSVKNDRNPWPAVQTFPLVHPPWPTRIPALPSV